MPRLALPVFAFALLFLCALQHGAAAQSGEKVSSSEEIAIAFFKTAGTNPDFEKWAKGHKDYARQTAVAAPDFLYTEEQRLMKAFRQYDPEEDVITIGTTVTVNLQAVKDKEGGEDAHWMYLNFSDQPITYFPFKFQDYKIAVIPQKIETMLIQPIQKAQYEMMRAEFKDKPVGTAKIYLGLKPSRAYIQQPYVIDNTDQWALLADVATMALHSSHSGSSFWYYTADWYVSPKADVLRDIYQSGQSGRGTGEAGSVPAHNPAR